MIKEDSDRLSALRAELRRRVGETRYELWFGDKTQLSLRGSQLLVAATSAAEQQWLRRKFGSLLRSVGHDLFGEQASVQYVVADSPRRGIAATDVKRTSNRAQSIDTSAPRTSAGTSEDKRKTRSTPAAASSTSTIENRSNRTASRTFDSFSAGEENLLALQTAREAVRQPGRYSPLLLCGPSGCGKSHLLTAIVEAVRILPNRRGALLLSAEQFTCQFLEALDQRALPGFRQKCRSADLLLIDDVQFLAGKRATLEELLNTIDSLQQREGQVVLTSDCPPAELSAMSGELQSRISGGLAVELQTPAYEARLAIVRAMVERLNVPMEHAVDEMIARQAVGSARLLSGAVNRLVATSMAVKRPISVELAGTVLTEFARQNVPQVRLVDIQRAVCQVFGVESTSLKSPSRSRRTSEPRMLAMYLARRYTRAALSEIGDFFGGRSHSTVASAQRKFERLISENSQLNVHDQPCPVEEALRRVESAMRTA